MCILVTGAAGNVGAVGFKIVKLLTEQGHQVRAMVRRFDSRSDALSCLGAEVVQGDLTDLGDVRRAMEGCKRIYFGMSVTASYLEATVCVAAVAKELGIEVLVNISQMTVSQMSLTQTTSSPQQKLHFLSEQVLNWSGLPIVHVRPTVFLDHFFFKLLASNTIRASDELQLPFGSGRTSPIATEDVAQVMVAILSNPAPHLGKVYELTGPRSLDLRGIAAEYSAALGREIKPVDVTVDEWVDEQLRPIGLDPHVDAHIRTMAQLHSENRYDRLTHTVEELTGRAPMGVKEWVQENKLLFEKHQ